MNFLSSHISQSPRKWLRTHSTQTVRHSSSETADRRVNRYRKKLFTLRLLRLAYRIRGSDQVWSVDRNRKRRRGRDAAESATAIGPIIALRPMRRVAQDQMRWSCHTAT